MHHQRLTDYELLCRVIGRRSASRLYRGALRPIFSNTNGQASGQARLLAAKELMERVIAEPLYEGPALESPQIVRDLLQLLYAGRGHESFCVLFLDATHRLIVEEEVFRGTLTQTSVYPREIVKQALQLNAAAVILAHNHPSGVPEPSRADEFLTQSLKSALALIDIRVLDHFVVGGGKTTSFAERGLL